jgi:hypothetical protein
MPTKIHLLAMGNINARFIYSFESTGKATIIVTSGLKFLHLPIEYGYVVGYVPEHGIPKEG